jgi:P-type Cu+ transporter
MSTCCSSPAIPGVSSTPEERRAGARHWLRLGLAALIAGQSMVFSFAVNLDEPEPTAYLLLHGLLAGAAVGVFLLVGGPLVRSAWEQLRLRRFSVEQFFLVGVLGAFAASVTSSITREGDVYYEVVSVLLAIYSLGRIVGERQRRKALASASALREAFETCLRVTCCGKEEKVRVSEIRRGDRVRIRAGAGVAVDGVMREGCALVSETPLNGEPFPVVKRVGDRLRAGSQVLDASVMVEASHDGCSREIDRLLESVEASVRGVSPLQREADRIVAWFLPVVLVLSLLTTLGWTWYAGWVVGLFNGLSVLVVACPCAMGLATPIALWSAAHTLAKMGLVPRKGDFVERLASVDTVVFDKTGTLSEEYLRVVDWVEVDGLDRMELESEVAAVQSQLDHPVARAFRDWRFSDEVVVQGGVETLAAKGIAALVCTPRGSHRLELGNEDLLLLGDRALFQSLKSRLHPEDQFAARWVVIRRDGVLAGVALLRENLRASAMAVIGAMRGLSLDVRVMTGDRMESAVALALTGVQAGMAAVEKADGVRELQAAGRKVLFVGDGVNDAPAMASAHASVALGLGAALSREAADAQLYGTDLSQLVRAVIISRATVARIRQNLWIAAAYNLIGITLAVSGMLHPLLAVVLMLISSATVSVRALRATDLDSAKSPIQHEPVVRTDVFGFSHASSGGAMAVLASAALGVQGLALVYLGGYAGGAALALAGCFAVAGCLLWSLRRYWQGHSYRTAFIVMVTVGNAGMMAGWWGDAGWGPAVRDGLCLCGCTGGHFVNALNSGTGWMHLGMFLGAIPGFWWDGKHQYPSRSWDWRWLACLAFMWLGMQGGAVFVRGWYPGFPQAQLLATFTAMSLGMILAMLVVCGPRLLEEYREEES